MNTIAKRLSCTILFVLSFTVFAEAEEYSYDCKLEEFECPDTLGETKSICHKNGDGDECTSCGTSTKCGDSISLF